MHACVQDACSDRGVLFAQRFTTALASETAVATRAILDGGELAGDTGEVGPLARIDGGNATPVSAVGAARHLALRGLRVSHGIGEGASRNNLGTPVVRRCRFGGHPPGNPAGIGALFDSLNAAVCIEDSTFDENGASRGGAVRKFGDAERHHNTLSGNIGGVHEGAIRTRGTLLGAQPTIAGNGRIAGRPAACGHAGPVPGSEGSMAALRPWTPGPPTGSRRRRSSRR